MRGSLAETQSRFSRPFLSLLSGERQRSEMRLVIVATFSFSAGLKFLMCNIGEIPSVLLNVNTGEDPSEL